MANTPAIGMILSQLLQQSGAAPPSSAPPMGTPAPSLGAPSPQPSAPAATPAPSSSPMASPVTELLSRATRSLSGPFQPAPSGGGVIDPSAHPVLAKVIQALAGGAAAYGWSGMPPGERLERTQLEQQKAETLARIAETGAWHESQMGLGQRRADIAEEQAQTAKKRAETAEERANAYKEIGDERNRILQEKSNWEKDIASKNYNNAVTRLKQQKDLFDEGLKQKKELFEQDLNLRRAKLEADDYFKDGAQSIMRAALQSGNAIKIADVQQKLTEAGLSHYIQDMLGNVPGVGGVLGQGAAGAATLPQPVPIAPPTGQPPMPGTPSNKATAKRNQKTPAAGGATKIYYDSQANRIPGPQ